MMDISNTTTQKARKTHCCSWCAELIAVAETYHRWTCFDNNSGDTVKMHDECRDAMHDSCVEFDDGVFDLYQHTRGCFCHRSQPCGKHHGKLAKVERDA